MNPVILCYEELSLNSHPALQTQLYDGWVLRFANGYTNRANSVSPLYPSALDLQEKIAECERRYFAQGLPCVFKLTDGTDPQIDRELDRLGYTVVTPTHLMEMEMRDFPFGDCVIASYADDEWLNAYFSFSRHTDSVTKDTAKRILQNVKAPMICGRIVKDEKTVACGACVIERGTAALLNIVVDEAQRGKGYGREICQSLLAAAARLGAHMSYLQVVQSNKIALSLYNKMGYQLVYSYWYRVKKGGAT